MRVQELTLRVQELRRGCELTRREFAGHAGRLVGALALGTACHAGATVRQDGRLRTRARTGTKTTASGTARLGLDARRDALLQVPANAGDRPLPLMVLLHGAGGSGEGILKRLASYASQSGIAVLSPDARDSTWDAIRDDFGPDVTFIDRCLEKVFEKVNVDPQRLSIGGFSDGATYALSLGLVNGDRFRRIVAYSPGFYVSGQLNGKPTIFISHGTEDDILPIDRCSRRIVPALKRAGYDVTFKEFIGGHTIPTEIAAAGMEFAAKS